MLYIWRYYQLNSARDISWSICSSIGLVVLIVILLIFIKTLQHIYCIPQSSADAGLRYKFETKHFNLYSTLSVTLATISALLIFLIFPACTQWTCLDTVLGHMFDILWLDSYLLSKVFLYLLFIGRLFNPHYIRLYQYPEYIQYSLWLTLILLIITVFAWNVLIALLLTGIEYHWSIGIITFTVYGITDCILSISLMILFFRPICMAKTCTVSAIWYKFIVRKYARLSALQLTSAVSFQIAVAVANVLRWTEVPWSTLRVYSDIRNVLSMLDCLLLISCIYSGFARQETVCDVHLVHLSVGWWLS